MNDTLLTTQKGDWENLQLLLDSGNNTQLGELLLDPVNFGRAFGAIKSNPRRFGLEGEPRNDTQTRLYVCNYLKGLQQAA